MPATKTLGLYFDNRIRMYSERHSSLMNAIIGSAPPKPYLRLKVRRDHLIADTLIGVFNRSGFFFFYKSYFEFY